MSAGNPARGHHARRVAIFTRFAGMALARFVATATVGSVATGVVMASAITIGTLVLSIGSSGCSRQPSAARYEYMDARKQEISMLWGQIRTWRRDAGLRGVEPPRRAILEMRGKPVLTARQVCAEPIEPSTAVCRDTCSLADAICENATQICRVADDLNGDPWADNKCSSAKASCREARQACCGCFRGEADAAAAQAEGDNALQPESVPESRRDESERNDGSDGSDGDGSNGDGNDGRDTSSNSGNARSSADGAESLTGGRRTWQPERADRATSEGRERPRLRSLKR